jgi:hypothetical protein
MNLLRRCCVANFSCLPASSAAVVVASNDPSSSVQTKKAQLAVVASARHSPTLNIHGNESNKK